MSPLSAVPQPVVTWTADDSAETVARDRAITTWLSRPAAAPPTEEAKAA